MQVILAASTNQKAGKAGKKFNLASIKVAASPTLEERLQSVERQIARLPFEVAVVFGSDGQELQRLQGDATTIMASDEQMTQMHGGYITHNHPDGSFFSLSDIRTAHQADLAEIRAVARKPTVVLYVLRRPAGGWDLAQFEALDKSETKRLLDKYWVSPFAPQLARDAAEQLAQAEWIRDFPGFLQKLGLQYEETLLRNC